MTPMRERLEAQFEALAPADRDERTATLTWYTGASVRRYDARGAYEMRFSMEPGAVRMGRLSSGSAPLLNSHRDFTVDDVIGVIARAWIENGQGKATVRFSKRADVDPIWQDVQDGILRNASMGVAIHAIEDVTPQGASLRQVLPGEGIKSPSMPALVLYCPRVDATGRWPRGRHTRLPESLWATAHPLWHSHSGGTLRTQGCFEGAVDRQEARKPPTRFGIRPLVTCSALG
jgi:hypothetical protein